MTSKTPVVFVVQENPNLNYTPAEKFGEVIFLTAAEFSPSKNSLRNVGIVKSIHDKLAEFDPDRDFLLLSGNPLMMCYAYGVAIAIKGYVRVLWYSRNDRDYIEVPFCPALLLDQANIGD